MSDSTNRPKTSFNQMGEHEKKAMTLSKSIRRHKLKEIDRKWKPKLEQGKAMTKALENKKEAHISKAFKTYGDRSKEHMGSFESRLDKYTKFKKQIHEKNN